MSASGQKAGATDGVKGSALDLFRSRYLHRFAPYLAECERRMAGITGQPGGSLESSSTMTLAAGGKRLRPLLVFLSARKGYEPGEDHYVAAVAVEMVHMATLVHDDVLDGAELRRGEPTVVSRYGPGVSIAAGDYLFSSAFDVLSATGSARSVSLLASTSLDLSRGELMQMAAAGDFSLTRQDYEERCRLKTSSLFATSCRLGALLSGCGDEVVEAMGRFGSCIGLAFQISDDILDFSGDGELTGKLSGVDLRDGTVTLPLILAMEQDRGLAPLLAGDLDEARITEICRRVRLSGGLESARRQAEGYVEQAARALSLVEGVIDTEPLELIAAATVDRST